MGHHRGVGLSCCEADCVGRSPTLLKDHERKKPGFRAGRFLRGKSMRRISPARSVRGGFVKDAGVDVLSPAGLAAVDGDDIAANLDQLRFENRQLDVAGGMALGFGDFLAIQVNDRILVVEQTQHGLTLEGSGDFHAAADPDFGGIPLGADVGLRCVTGAEAALALGPGRIVEISLFPTGRRRGGGVTGGLGILLGGGNHGYVSRHPAY